MNADELLSCYAELHTLSQEMLLHAQQEQWDELLALEQARIPLLQQIANVDLSDFDLPAATRVALQEQIAAILEADRQTGELTESWLSELRGIFASANNERKISDTYR
ncbi:flagellar protein FliT [Chitinivorax sp. B]|uniref:flagellar protein FliT n=1 Tax=Chitinivorax sp. B TaxID=2502235 RepID=UPI0010F93D70|nr:flagellar protein FliT [Chitinivorax sp. B]